MKYNRILNVCFIILYVLIIGIMGNINQKLKKIELSTRPLIDKTHGHFVIKFKEGDSWYLTSGITRGATVVLVNEGMEIFNEPKNANGRRVISEYIP